MFFALFFASFRCYFTHFLPLLSNFTWFISVGCSIIYAVHRKYIVSVLCSFHIAFSRVCALRIHRDWAYTMRLVLTTMMLNPWLISNAVYCIFYRLNSFHIIRGIIFSVDSLSSLWGVNSNKRALLWYPVHTTIFDSWLMYVRDLFAPECLCASLYEHELVCMQALECRNAWNKRIFRHCCLNDVYCARYLPVEMEIWATFYDTSSLALAQPPRSPTHSITRQCLPIIELHKIQHQCKHTQQCVNVVVVFSVHT